MPAGGQEPALRPDELRVLRQMMSEYQQSKAVGVWFTAKRRTAVAVLGAVSVTVVMIASTIEIVRTLLP